MSYLIAIIGCLLIVPYPVLGALTFAGAVWWHEAGFANPASEWGELLLFYAALVGIVSVVLL